MRAYDEDEVLSDGLMEMRQLLRPYETSGLQISAEGMTKILQSLKAMTTVARRLESEVDRLRWNLKAARDADRDPDEIAQVAMRPGSNVVLLAPARPFGDGRPRR